MTTVSEGDRELLELAAKAAGYEAVRPATFGMGCWMALSEGEWQPWNPLTDDGDAFRLAVKLREQGVAIALSGKQETAGVVIGDVGLSERFGNDPYAATRRAVVRAASSIGKSQSNGRSE